MRSNPLAVLVMLAGLAAAAASTPSAGEGLSGSSQSFAVLLDEGAPDAEVRVTALLDAQVAIADNGRIDLTAFFDDADVGQVQLSVTAEETGEFTDTTVLDPVVQPEVSIGIAAFVGCDGLSPCEENLTIRFERLEVDVTNTLEFEWQLDGFVSLLDPEAEIVGSLTFNEE